MCIGRYCYRKLSVRLSVRPSVVLMYLGYVGWVTSRAIITRIISYIVFAGRKIGDLIQTKHREVFDEINLGVGNRPLIC